MIRKELAHYNADHYNCCRCLYWCLHLMLFSGLLVYFFYRIDIHHEDFQALNKLQENVLENWQT